MSRREAPGRAPPPSPAPRQYRSERRGGKGVVNSHVVGTALGDRASVVFLDLWGGGRMMENQRVLWDFTEQRGDGDDRGGFSGPSTVFKVEKLGAPLTR